MTDWQKSDPDNLELSIKIFKKILPGWWFRIGECQVSSDASCGPTRESPHICLINFDDRFDSGFHADLSQPSTMAEALSTVMVQACAAIEKAEAKMRDEEQLDRVAQ